MLFTPINQSFMENVALQRLEDATEDVGLNHVLNTFDLGSCMNALPLETSRPIQ